MKYTIISLFLLACHSLSAQHILNHEANAPHVGDRLKPLHVELSKGSFDEEQHLWDFSRMQSLEANSRQRYVMTGDSAKQRTARIENGQRTYYNIKGDSLLITGRESRLTKVMYDEPELFLRFPNQRDRFLIPAAINSTAFRFSYKNSSKNNYAKDWKRAKRNRYTAGIKTLSL